MAHELDATARTGSVSTAGQAATGEINLRKRPRLGESIIQALLFFCGAVSILTTIGIVVVLLREAWTFFTDDRVNILEFFTTTTWQPQIAQFGILPLVNATLLTSLIAMVVALPLGLAAAIYLSEYATQRMRGWLKPILEVLAGVPTVVYGFFALTFMTPLLQRGFSGVDFQNMASAGIVMGIMIVPIIASMSEDALSAVPRPLREAAYGLGSTRLEVATRIVLPAAVSGIVAAVIVGVSRAVGETMIVAIAAGSRPLLTFNPFKSAETMTGNIARISGGDLSYGSIDYTSVYAIGLTLFVMTMVLNLVSARIVRRFREVYE